MLFLEQEQDRGRILVAAGLAAARHINQRRDSRWYYVTRPAVLALYHHEAVDLDVVASLLFTCFVFIYPFWATLITT